MNNRARPAGDLPAPQRAAPSIADVESFELPDTQIHETQLSAKLVSPRHSVLDDVPDSYHAVTRCIRVATVAASAAMIAVTLSFATKSLRNTTLLKGAVARTLHLGTPAALGAGVFYYLHDTAALRHLSPTRDGAPWTYTRIADGRDFHAQRALQSLPLLSPVSGAATGVASALGVLAWCPGVFSWWYTPNLSRPEAMRRHLSTTRVAIRPLLPPMVAAGAVVGAFGGWLADRQIDAARMRARPMSNRVPSHVRVSESGRTDHLGRPIFMPEDVTDSRKGM